MTKTYISEVNLIGKTYFNEKCYTLFKKKYLIN